MTPIQGVAANEKQVVTVPDSATTGDDYKLKVPINVAGAAGTLTADIAFDAAAAAVQSALVATPDFGPGDVVVTGDAGGPYTVEFKGVYESKAVGLLVADSAGIASGDDVEVERTVGGRGTDTTNTGVDMLPGDEDEPVGPEDALGEGEKRGDYSDRMDSSQHFEGGREQSAGPRGDHSDEPEAKGGVTTTPDE